MLRKQLGTLILVTCFILTIVPTVLGTPGVSEVYIVGNWSGDFNDGEDNYAQINQTTTNKTAVMENMLEQEVETNISCAEDTSITDESQTMINDTIPTDSIEQETKNANTVNDQINAIEVSFNNTTVVEPALEQGFETGIEADSITDNRLKEAAPNTAYK
ncbi:MAG: hypothetical protein GX152_02045, partial [Methanosarcina sp.]|nr:hypothetical protein [Methanosarcina sp.]